MLVSAIRVISKMIIGSRLLKIRAIVGSFSRCSPQSLSEGTQEATFTVFIHSRLLRVSEMLV